MLPMSNAELVFLLMFLLNAIWLLLYEMKFVVFGHVVAIPCFSVIVSYNVCLEARFADFSEDVRLL